MKALFFFVSITISLFGIAQNDSISEKVKPHKRFGFGGVPILAFDSDLGLKYGVVLNFFDYGEKFPKYLQYAKLKAFKTTNGTSNLSLTYDNNSLFKKTKFIFESTYTKDVLLNFYGVNGINSIYNPNNINYKSIDYINPYYYKQQRQLLRFRLDFQRLLNKKQLYVIYGLNYNRYMMDKTDLSKFEIQLGESQTSINTTTLFDDYVNQGVINSDEVNGGEFFTFKLGVTYDTRNNQINCSDGVFFETYFIHSPKLMDSKDFTKHIITFRQYYMVKKIKTLLTYRLSSQQKIGGNIPYYYLPTFHDLAIDTDGVGGAFNLRGISRNRIAADGFIVANFEVRKNILRFNALKQKWNIELSAFSDLVYVTQNYNVSTNTLNPLLFNSNSQAVSYTYGAGIYFIYGTNNIISVNFGISPDKSLGNTGLYIGSLFLF